MYSTAYCLVSHVQYSLLYHLVNDAADVLLLLQVGMQTGNQASARAKHGVSSRHRATVHSWWYCVIFARGHAVAGQTVDMRCNRTP